MVRLTLFFLLFLFFFFKQKTAYEMRISDWSSDVCSSDLPAIDLTSSSTRRDDLLLDKETLQRIWILRNHLADMNSNEAMEFLLQQLRGTKNNEDRKSVV